MDRVPPNDAERINRKPVDERNPASTEHHDPIGAFKDAIAAAGLPVPAHIEADGQLHRFSTNGRNGDSAGYYVLHLDGIPAGHFGCWRTGFSQNWSARNGGQLDREELDRLRAAMEEARAVREARREARYVERAELAKVLWSEAEPADENHPYLLRKSLKPCDGVRQSTVSLSEWFDDPSRVGALRDCLLIPVLNEHGDIQSLEAITPKGEKYFLAGAKKAGGFSVMPGLDLVGECSALYIVEGWATGASIRTATNAAVAVAFDSGNLRLVADFMAKRYPEQQLVIAGDNDRKEDGTNPGRDAADAVARDTGALLMLPPFDDEEPGSDWNDYHANRGIWALCEALDVKAELKRLATLRMVNSFKAKHLLATEPPPQQYVIDGLIPEPVAAAIVAPGSTGKSFWLMQLAACVASGTPFMGQTVPRPGGVLMLGAEDDRDEMARRLQSIVREYEWDGCRLDPEALGENFYPMSVLGQDNRLTYHDGRDIVRDARRVNEVIATANSIPNLRLIIIDPVSRFRSGDENDNEAATRFVEVLEQIRQETGVTVLCAHHSRKGSTGDGADDIRGASAFVDALRFAGTLSKPKPGKGLPRDEADKLVRFNVVKSNYRTDLSEHWMRRGVGGVLKPTTPPQPPRAESSASDDKAEARYLDSLPTLASLVKSHADTDQPLTRRSIRQYAGTSGIFRMGDQNLRGVVSRAIEEGYLAVGDDHALKVLKEPPEVG